MTRFISVILLLVGACLPAVSTGGASPTTLPAGYDTRHENTPRGKVEKVSYRSVATGGNRPALVYLPPGYSTREKYPVLYLLHGAGSDETGWVHEGAADVILDNLLEEKKCVPMVVVMPRGFAVKPGQVVPATMPAKMLQGTLAFEDDLLGDLIPFVESHYSAQADRTHRAIVGFSMGGGQALRIGLAHQDQFAWIGGFSSAPVGMPVEEYLKDPKRVNEQVRLLWLSCGDKDFWMWPNAGIHAMLTDKGINHVWQIDSGGHDWRVWKADLYRLAPMLFGEHEGNGKLKSKNGR